MHIDTYCKQVYLETCVYTHHNYICIQCPCTFCVLFLKVVVSSKTSWWMRRDMNHIKFSKHWEITRKMFHWKALSAYKTYQCPKQEHTLSMCFSSFMFPRNHCYLLFGRDSYLWMIQLFSHSLFIHGAPLVRIKAELCLCYGLFLSIWRENYVGYLFQQDFGPVWKVMEYEGQWCLSITVDRNQEI